MILLHRNRMIFFIIISSLVFSPFSSVALTFFLIGLVVSVVLVRQFGLHELHSVERVNFSLHVGLPLLFCKSPVFPVQLAAFALEVPPDLALAAAGVDFLLHHRVVLIVGRLLVEGWVLSDLRVDMLIHRLVAAFVIQDLFFDVGIDAFGPIAIPSVIGLLALVLLDAVGVGLNMESEDSVSVLRGVIFDFLLFVGF